MTDGAPESRRSYTVVFDSNVGDFVGFLQRLKDAVEQTSPCDDVQDWKGVGATMMIRVNENAIEVIACPVHEVSFGNTMLNIAEPFSFLKVLRKPDFKSIRAAALSVRDGLLHCGIPFESQAWAKSNPPAFDTVDDWMIGRFPY